MPAFFSPWFLLGAVAVAVPFVLHLLRREQTPRARVHRGALPAPRAARAAAAAGPARLCCCSAARAGAARPGGRVRAAVLRGPGGGGGLTMVAVDTSFSMGAPGRIDRAREAAARAIAAVPGGERVAVIRVDDRATVVAGRAWIAGPRGLPSPRCRRGTAAPPSRRCGAPRRAWPAPRAAVSS